MDISIIIVSYNTKQILQNCIKSIYKYTQNVSFEIIVVDNGSTDGSVGLLQKLEQNKKIIFIKSLQNLGFGTANNLASQKARGKYLLFLNPDTLFISNCLPVSLNWLKNKPKVGAMTIKLLNKNKSIQPTGGYFPTLLRVLVWQLFLEDWPFMGSLFKSIHPHEPGFFFLNRLVKKPLFVPSKGSVYDKLFFPDWITGAFMLIPASIFKKAKGFDEKIFMYVEETQLCYRIKKLGFKIAYAPIDSIIHLSGASSGSIDSLVWEAINTLYFFNKHYSSFSAFLARVIIIIGSILRLLIFGIIGRNQDKQKAYAQIIQRLI